MMAHSVRTLSLWRKLIPFCAALLLVASLGAASAFADIDIFDNTHTYNDVNGGIGSVSIAVDVDRVGGLYLWEYTVTNNSFNPAGGNGFSGFELALPAFPADLGNVTTPAGWNNNCCSVAPEEWDIPSFVPNADGNSNFGSGLMPGDTGVFSFTSLPRTITTSTGWFHTWSDIGAPGSPFSAQTSISTYSLTPGETGPEVPNVLLPPTTPEPGTLILFGTGVAALCGRLRRRRKV